MAELGGRVRRLESFTYDPDRAEGNLTQRTGYAVADGTYFVTLELGQISDSSVLAALQQLVTWRSALLSGEVCRHIGGWFDAPAGKYLLALTAVVECASEARRLAELHRQRFVYDFALGRDIRPEDLPSAPSRVQAAPVKTPNSVTPRPATRPPSVVDSSRGESAPPQLLQGNTVVTLLRYLAGDRHVPGEREAWAWLWQYIVRRASRHLSCGLSAEAEDIAQTIVRDMLERPEGVLTAVERAFTAYVGGILKRKAADAGRGRKGREAGNIADACLPDPRAQDPSDQAAAAEAIARIRERAEESYPGSADAIISTLEGSSTQEEAARKLGIRRETLNRLLQQLLRAELRTIKG